MKLSAFLATLSFVILFITLMILCREVRVTLQYISCRVGYNTYEIKCPNNPLFCTLKGDNNPQFRYNFSRYCLNLSQIDEKCMWMNEVYLSRFYKNNK